MEEVTARQGEVYDYIRRHIFANGYAPSVRDIGEEFGINSPNGVLYHIRALTKKGRILKSPNLSRAIAITEDVPIEARDSSELPPGQRRVYDAIVEHVRKYGIAPTYRYLGKMTGIKSPNGVRCHLKALRRKRYISTATNKARGITLLPPPLELVIPPSPSPVAPPAKPAARKRPPREPKPLKRAKYVPPVKPAPPPTAPPDRPVRISFRFL